MPRNRKPRARRPPDPAYPPEPRRRGGSASAGIILASLALLLALQLWGSWGRFDPPFLDTRLHYNFDNANFSFQARNGNRNGDPRSQFGVTQNTYSRWGERRGEPAYYTHHPFLVKTLFQQFARIAGTGEAASRLFYLAVSFGIAAGAFVVFRQATGSEVASFAGAAVLVSLPLFAVYQTVVKFETDGMLVSVWLFAALNSHLAKGGNRRLAVYGVLTSLAFLVHWTAWLFVACVGVFLLAVWLRTREPERLRALIVTAAAAAVGTALLGSLMAYLQGSLRRAMEVLRQQFAIRSAAVSWSDWLERQWTYAKMNFSDALPWILIGLSVALMGALFSSRRTDSLTPLRRLAPFIWTTLATAVAWLVLFRQGSHIHAYWQYWFCLPIAALVAGLLATVRRHKLGFRAGILACIALIAVLRPAAAKSSASIRADQLGTSGDIAFLQSLRDDPFNRFVFVPLTEAPLNAWFHGPLFEYYTDRGVVAATSDQDVQPGDKVLVLRYKQREQVAARLADWSGRTLANEKCGERICAYDVAE